MQSADRNGSTRRAALRRLGLGVAVAYTSPMLLDIGVGVHAKGKWDESNGQGLGTQGALDGESSHESGWGPCSNPSRVSPPGGSSGQGDGCEVSRGGG